MEPSSLPLALRGVSDSAFGLAKGDFDGDGRLDVAVTGVGRLDPAGPPDGIDFVAVLPGNGDGTFQGPLVVELGPSRSLVPWGIAAADLDEDGILDLVVVAYVTSEVLVLRGRGDGTFEAPAASATGLARAHVVQAADFDGDGHADLAVTSVYDDVPGQVAVLRGDGAGRLGAPTLHSVGRLPHGMAVADVDGAGGPDVLTVSFAGGTLDVLLNDGTGNFPATATSYSARTTPTGLAVADFDLDGHPDAMMSGRDGVLVAAGNGDGSFQSPAVGSLIRTEFWLQRILGDGPPVDLDGDGVPDPLFTHIEDVNLVTVLLSKGGMHPAEWVASPGPPVPLDAAGYPERLHLFGAVAGDFDGDGVKDAVVAAGSHDARPGGLSLLRGLPGAPGTFAAPRVFPARTNWSSAAPGGMALGAVDSRAGLDLAMLADAIDVLPGTGDGALGPGALALGHWSNTGVNGLRLVDLDLDGKLDALYLGVGGVQGGPGPLHYLARGAGDGTFQAWAALTPAGDLGGRNVVVADFDRDGRPDLFVLTLWIGSTVPATRTQIEVWKNGAPASPGGPPAFANTAVLDVQTSPGGLAFWASTALAAGDFDGDGELDLVAQRNDDGAGDDLLLFRGSGDGTFGAAEVVWSDFRATLTDLSPADLDGDGALDLVALGGNSALFLRGRGNGRFDAPVNDVPCIAPAAGRLADLDGDGRSDLLIACGNGLVVLPGKGDGSFGPRMPLAFGTTAAYDLAVGDLDGDGRPDLVVGHPTGYPGQNRYFTVLRDDSGPRADLGLAMSRAPASAHVSAVVTHTLVCVNRGPDAATGVTLRDPLRGGPGLVSAAASQGSCAGVGGVVTCALGDLPVGATATVTVKLRPAQAGTLWNGASVRASEPDPAMADNGASVATPVAGELADLSASLSASPDPVDVGAPLTWTARVANAGPSRVAAAAGRLALPGGVSFGSATVTAGSCTSAAGAVTCAFGPLGAGEGASATVVVTPTPAAAATLSATLAASGAEGDPVTGNDAATATVGVTQVADVGASLAARPASVEAGGTVTYELVASNAGPSRATAVRATLPVPAGAAFVSATSGQGACSFATGTVTCALGELEAGRSAPATVVVTATAEGTLTAQVTVLAAEKDPATADNAASVAVGVSPAPASKKGGCGCGAGEAGAAGLALLLCAPLLRPGPRRRRSAPPSWAT